MDNERMKERTGKILRRSHSGTPISSYYGKTIKPHDAHKESLRRLYRQTGGTIKIEYSREGAEVKTEKAIYGIDPMGLGKRGFRRFVEDMFGKSVYNMCKVTRTDRETGQKREGIMVMNDSIVSILKNSGHESHIEAKNALIDGMNRKNLFRHIEKSGVDTSTRLLAEQGNQFSGYYGDLIGGSLLVGGTYNRSHAKLIDGGILAKREKKRQEDRQKQDGYDR